MATAECSGAICNHFLAVQQIVDQREGQKGSEEEKDCHFIASFVCVLVAHFALL